MTRATPVLIDSTVLTPVIRECFEGLGLSSADAQAVADVLVDANLRGIDSHGFQRVPIYMRRVKAGLAGGTEAMTEVARVGAVCRLDAGHALGPAAAVKAVDLAIDLAGDHGIGLVSVGRSTHFGAAGFYARRAAAKRLVGLALTNGPKNMAPHGSSEPFLGTNALAIAAPLGRYPEFVVDMSLSIGARGKIIRAKALGEAIEPGLAIDRDGHPTTDPGAALAGSVLPVGGPKGTGLAVAIEILASLLAGAEFGFEMSPMYGTLERPQNVGHVFVVIDPWRLSEPETAIPRLEQFVDGLHALRLADGFKSVRYAGEAGALRARERLASGIPIDVSEVEALAAVCTECGLPALAARVRALSPGR